MLLELRAENYAVIDRATVHFGPGLNLLTGETGAGKSILIDALALLLGEKASSDFVRHGSEKAVLACSFESTAAAAAILDENGIDAEGDEIMLRREIAATGKGRVFINNQPATVAVLRQLAPELALVHSQGETLGSFDQAQQMELLDRFAGLSTVRMAALFREWRETAARLEELKGSESDRLRLADLWRFQAAEIDRAGLTSGDEDAQLEAEKLVLGNAERLHLAARNAHDLLYESEHSAEGALGSALKYLDELARFEPAFEAARQQIAGAKAAVEDVSSEARRFADGMDASPERLALIEDRLAELDRLKRKYGGSLEEVMEFGRGAAHRLAEIDDREAVLEELEARLRQREAAFQEEAAQLSEARQAAGKRLAAEVAEQVNDLAMRATFEIAVTPEKAQAGWSATGWDRLSYRIATNLGEPLKPLAEIASGGEMSRVLLALKVTVEAAAEKRQRGRSAAAAPQRSLVFDEVDIGIGGRAAEAVGRKLFQLSRSQQVLCITHLPQIAAFADQHFLIEKSEAGGRTRTGVRQMDAAERTGEIARMLSGAELTETSLRHAEHLIELSR